jgi:hypothetical protein
MVHFAKNHEFCLIAERLGIVHEVLKCLFQIGEFAIGVAVTVTKDLKPRPTDEPVPSFDVQIKPDFNGISSGFILPLVDSTAAALTAKARNELFDAVFDH